MNTRPNPRLSFLAVTVLTLGLWAGSPGAAWAQRAAENVVRTADDAFGASVGAETIGLYSNRNVRGFSPVDAGNIRVEGLTIDRQDSFSDRLISGSTIRAGLAAQGYLLPAPTGIVDFSLRSVAEDPVQSVIAARTPYGGYNLSGDFQARTMGKRAEFAGGAGYTKNASGNGSTDKWFSFGGNARVVLGPGADVIVFADFYETILNQRWASYFTETPDLPPRVDERKLYVAQDWVELASDSHNLGLLGRFRTDFADFEVGVFRSVTKNTAQTGQFFVDVEPDGASNLFAFFGPPTRSASTSMEARAKKGFADGPRLHRLSLNVRARTRKQLFGGTQSVDLGPMNINDPLFFPMPEFAFGARTREDVDQITGGIGYDLKWKEVGSISLGLQKTRYERSIGEIGDAPLDGEASPLLYNASASFNVTSWLTLYGGYVRGFEEGPVAPEFAVNRNQAPAAIETKQADAGARVRFGGLTAVAGVFSLEKPFFALNADNVFGPAGSVRNRGFEFSVAGQIIETVQMVLGAVFFDPSLSGEPIDLGLLSPDPIEFRNKRITLDLDYRPGWAQGWSFDLSAQHLGRQNADLQGDLTIDPYTILNLGFRKQWQVRDVTLVLRARAVNVTNTFSWTASSSGGFFFEEPRGFSVSLGADF
ncbi:MAG: TonB-dependent receptor [Pseudomonadota bacterium]